MVRWPTWVIDLTPPAARGRLWIRIETFAVGLLGGVTGALVVLGLASIAAAGRTLAWFDRHPGAAGWFQAFGAIAALVVAVGLPVVSGAQGRKRLRITAYQLAVEAITEVQGYFDRINARRPAWTASEDPDEGLARVANALDGFPASELAVLGGLRSFIAIGVLIRRGQAMLPEIAQARTSGRPRKSTYTLRDLEYLLEDLGIEVEELRKDLGMPRTR